MSSLRKRKDGWYFIEIRIERKRHRIALHTRERKLARARAKIKERELQESPFVISFYLDDFILEYLEYAKPLKAPNTIATERYALKKFRQLVGNTLLEKISPRMIDEFIASMARNQKPAGVNIYIRTLRSIFSTALKWQYVGKNPFAGIKLMRYEKPIPKILSLQQIALFFEKAKEMYPALVPLYEFYLLTGARRGEALQLTWQDIDFEKKIIIFRKTKGKRPRIMFMSPRVYKILKARSELPMPFDFEPHRPSDNFKQIVRALGFEGLSLRNLRKSFASYMADCGISDFYLTWLMGHTDRDITRQHYTGFDDQIIARYLLDLEKKLFSN